MYNEDIRNKKICILGAGYVGLTLGLTLADLGYKVLMVEKNKDIIRMLSEGRSHVVENGIEDILKREIGKNFIVTDNILEINADIYIVSVGTPIDEYKKPFFGHIEDVSRDISYVLKKGDLVILRSTVSPGTTRNIVMPILSSNKSLVAGSDYFLAFAPERTAEGIAMGELRYIPQIVGGINEQSILMASLLFSTITKKIVKVSSLEVAEMVKLADNTYRDATFAISNLFALVCDKFNLDTHEVIDAANFEYKRGGMPKPSPGVGGSCLSKDPYIFIDAAKKMGCSMNFIEHTRSINEAMPQHVVSKVIEFFRVKRDEGMKNKNILIKGVAFKGHPETGDIRFSPSINVIDILKELGANIYAYDPIVDVKDIESLGIQFLNIKESMLKDIDAILILNNNKAFGSLDIDRYFSNLSKPVLFFDAWKMYSPEKIKRVKNLIYANLGYDQINL